MEKKFLRISALFLISIFFFANTACAVSTAAPNIKIKKQKDASITLQVIEPDLAKKNVKIKVKIENQDNDTSSTKTFDVKMSKSGKANLKIDGLAKDVEYSFKAMIKKSSGGNYSSYSDTVSINRSGDSPHNTKIGVSDVLSNAFTLKVTSTTLQKQNVKIKVRIENEDTDKIETRVFSKKLNKKGVAQITIEGLNSDTQYKVTAAIKKKKDDTYSSFSHEKSITTD